MQLLRRAVQRQAVLSDVAELRDAQRKVMGFKLAFGGHPLFCFADGGVLQEALSLPQPLQGLTEWNMIRHLPWTRALGLPLEAARELQNDKDEWVALQLSFASDVDPGVTLQLALRDTVEVLVVTDEELAPGSVSSP